MNDHSASSMAMRIALSSWLLLGLLFAAAPSRAADNTGQDVRVKRLHVELRVNADGTYVEDTDWMQQVNSPRAVEQAGQIRIPYSSSLDKFEVVEAKTLKQDGRSIEVAASSIFTQDGLISPQGVTSFQDIKTTVAVFPDLDPGDSIEIHTRVTRQRPMLPGVFSYSRVFGSELQFDDVSISLTAPKALALAVENVGLQASPPVEIDGQVRSTWTYRNAVVKWPEDDAVDPIMYQPRLLISSLASYDDLARAAAAAFAGKAAPSEPIRAVAEQITRGAQTPLEQARRLQEWVAHNVRYFAIELSIGGYVPRPAEEVLLTRFGDCKDHEVLLQALLAAKGIASMPALLTTQPIYQLPGVPVLAAFNHVIVYVPSLGVYLDTNTPSVSFGALPSVDADKPVLLLGAAVPRARTPSVTAEQNVTTLTTDVTIAADGSASGEDLLTATGASGIAYGALADALTGTDPVKVAQGVLLNANLAGEGTATARRISNSGSFRFDLLYELQDYAPLDQPGGVRPVPPMDFLGMAARGEVSSAPTRTLQYQCVAQINEEVINLHFPPGLQIGVPKNVSVSAGARSYESSYVVEGSSVKVRRRFISRVPRGTCEPADFPAARALEESILRDLRAELRYTPLTSAH